jgi:hypothetical protein
MAPTPISPNKPSSPDSKFDVEVLSKDWKFQDGPFKKDAPETTSTFFEEMEALEEGPNLYIPAVRIDATCFAGPLYEPQLEGVLLPHLMDSISCALTAVSCII